MAFASQSPSAPKPSASAGKCRADTRQIAYSLLVPGFPHLAIHWGNAVGISLLQRSTPSAAGNTRLQATTWNAADVLLAKVRMSRAGGPPPAPTRMPPPTAHHPLPRTPWPVQDCKLASAAYLRSNSGEIPAVLAGAALAAAASPVPLAPSTPAAIAPRRAPACGCQDDAEDVAPRGTATATPPAAPSATAPAAPKQRRRSQPGQSPLAALITATFLLALHSEEEPAQQPEPQPAKPHRQQKPSSRRGRTPPAPQAKCSSRRSPAQPRHQQQQQQQQQQQRRAQRQHRGRC